MFIRLTSANKHGAIEERLIAVDDISLVKPAPDHVRPAKSCVSMRSQPDFPVWAIETQLEVEDLLLALGVKVAAPMEDS